MEPIFVHFFFFKIEQKSKGLSMRYENVRGRTLLFLLQV